MSVSLYLILAVILCCSLVQTYRAFALERRVGLSWYVVDDAAIALKGQVEDLHGRARAFARENAVFAVIVTGCLILAISLMAAGIGATIVAVCAAGLSTALIRGQAENVRELKQAIRSFTDAHGYDPLAGSDAVLGSA